MLGTCLSLSASECSASCSFCCSCSCSWCCFSFPFFLYFVVCCCCRRRRLFFVIFFFFYFGVCFGLVWFGCFSIHHLVVLLLLMLLLLLSPLLLLLKNHLSWPPLGRQQGARWCCRGEGRRQGEGDVNTNCPSVPKFHACFTAIYFKETLPIREYILITFWTSRHS